MDETIKFLRKLREKYFSYDPDFKGQGIYTDWDFAENLMRDVLYRDLGRSVETHFNRESEKVRLLCKHLPDPNREPISFWGLVANQILVETASKNLGYINPSVLIDIVPSGSVNALTVKSDKSDDHIILVHLGLRNFSSLVIKVIASAWRELPQNLLVFEEIPDYFGIKSKLDRNPELARQFARIMLGVLFDGHPIEAAKYAMKNFTPDPLTATLEKASEIFMLAHEYSHVIGGHLLGEIAPESGIHVWLADGTPVELNDEAMRRWNEESQSDELALQVVFKVAQLLRWDFDVAYAGVEMFLGCVDHLEKGMNVVMRGNTDVPASIMHPPTYTRRDRLRKRVTETLPREVADMLIRVGKLSEYVVKVLFGEILKILLIEHVKGTRLATHLQTKSM